MGRVSPEPRLTVSGLADPQHLLRSFKTERFRKIGNDLSACQHGLVESAASAQRTAQGCRVSRLRGAVHSGLQRPAPGEKGEVHGGVRGVSDNLNGKSPPHTYFMHLQIEEEVKAISGVGWGIAKMRAPIQGLVPKLC